MLSNDRTFDLNRAHSEKIDEFYFYLSSVQLKKRENRKWTKTILTRIDNLNKLLKVFSLNEICAQILDSAVASPQENGNG